MIVVMIKNGTLKALVAITKAWIYILKLKSILKPSKNLLDCFPFVIITFSTYMKMFIKQTIKKKIKMKRQNW